MQTTLVLDNCYQPINIVNWSKAMGYIVKDKCDILEEYEQEIHFTYDGQEGMRIHKEDIIRIRKSDKITRLVRTKTYKFFDLIRKKLIKSY